MKGQNEVLPVQNENLLDRVKSPSGSELEPRYGQVTSGAIGPQMVNPAMPMHYDEPQVRDPGIILKEMYLKEGGLESGESDEPMMIGCRRTCGTCCEGCTNEQINEGYVGVVTEFGKFVKIVKSGAQSYNPCTQSIRRVPVVIQVLNLPDQRVLTKDGLQLSIKAYVKYQVIHPQLYLFNHNNADDLLRKTVTGTLRSVIGMRTLKDNLSNQTGVKKAVADLIRHRIEEYGLVVYDAEIERMAMDVNLQRALAVVAEAEREYKSKIVKSKASLKSSEIFRMAADELTKNPLSLQLKYFDLLKDITKGNSKLLLRDTIVEGMKKKNLRKN